MRIISGKYKGKKLNPPKNLPVRPTTDFAKEALFNLLRSRLDIEDSTILELCAGTGNITFDFASRGAEKITAIDHHSACVNYIKQQAADLDFTAIRAIKADLFNFLKTVSGKYDLIFADPPYALEGVEQLPSMILQKNILLDDGLLIIEHDKSIDFEEEEGYMFSRKYGNVNFTFFEAIKQ